MRSGRFGLVVALVAVAGGACRSGGAKVPVGPSGADVLKEYVGQRRVLIGHGDSKSVSIKPGQPAPAQGCDVAVEITAAVPAGKGVALTLQPLGRPQVGEGKVAGRCKELPRQIAMTVEGVSASNGPALRAALDGVALTPEGYLAARGKTLDLAPQPAPAIVADPSLAVEAESRSLARKVKTWPKPLLTVEPMVRDPKGKLTYEGELEFTAVVGADGRVYRPEVKTSLSEEHEGRIRSVLEIWRFEPAQDADKKMLAARYNGRTVFRIY